MLTISFEKHCLIFYLTLLPLEEEHVRRSVHTTRLLPEEDPLEHCNEDEDDDDVRIQLLKSEARPNSEDNISEASHHLARSRSRSPSSSLLKANPIKVETRGKHYDSKDAKA